VVSMRFAEKGAAPAEPAGPFGLPLSGALMARLAESALLALVALAAILVVGRPLVGRLSAAAPQAPAAAGAAAALPGRGAGEVDAAAALPEGAEAAAALPPAEGMVSLAHVQGQMRASSLAALTRLVDNHPDESLAVLRRWLSPQEAQ